VASNTRAWDRKNLRISRNNSLYLVNVTRWTHIFCERFVSDIAIFVLKRDVKLQLTNFCERRTGGCMRSIIWWHCRWLRVTAITSNYPCHILLRMGVVRVTWPILNFWSQSYLWNS